MIYFVEDEVYALVISQKEYHYDFVVLHFGKVLYGYWGIDECLADQEVM